MNEIWPQLQEVYEAQSKVLTMKCEEYGRLDGIYSLLEELRKKPAIYKV